MKVISLTLCALAASAALRLPAPRSNGVTRRDATAALLGAAVAPLAAPLCAHADDAADVVMKGVLQLNKGEKLPPLPEGTAATVTLRVVGRNTKGALATATVPLDGVEFPVSGLLPWCTADGSTLEPGQPGLLTWPAWRG